MTPLCILAGLLILAAWVWYEYLHPVEIDQYGNPIPNTRQ